MNKMIGGLEIATRGDRELVFTRTFNAPRRLVFEAMTTPHLLQRWLGVHNGWSLNVCTIDLRVGGAYRYEWANRTGLRMGMGGVFLEIDAPAKVVNTERFDDHWYPGDAVDTLELVEREGITHMTMTVCYESPEALASALKTPMEQGMALGYDTLEAQLPLMFPGQL
jgi:uncharacterized protein YndB with AHSA1/START domain